MHVFVGFAGVIQSPRWQPQVEGMIHITSFISTETGQTLNKIYKSIKPIPTDMVLMVSMLHLHISGEYKGIQWSVNRDYISGTSMDDPIAIVHRQFHILLNIFSGRKIAPNLGFRLIFTYHQVRAETSLLCFLP